MTTQTFRRPARRSGPEMPAGEISLHEPPDMPESQSGGGMRNMMMILPMALMSGVMMLMFTGGSRGPMTYLMAGMMAVAMGGMAAGQAMGSGGDRKRKLSGDRRDYLRYLGQMRRRVRGHVAEQQQATVWRHPDPAALWSLAMTSRRWERRPTHPDFMEIRVGTAEQRLAVRISPLQTKPVEDLEPVAAKSLRRFIRAYTSVGDQPVALYLPGFARINLRGDRGPARDLLRAALLQVATLHAAEEVHIAFCLDDEGRRAWDLAKWLPHTQHPTGQDAAGQARLCGDSIEALEQVLGETFTSRGRYEAGAPASRDEPFVVVVRDGGRAGANSRFVTAGYRNAVLVDLDDEGPVTASREVLTLEVTAEDVTMLRPDPGGEDLRNRLATPDVMGPALARATARVLSPYRLGANAEPVIEPMTKNFDLGALLGIENVGELDLKTLWAPMPAEDRLQVPIGIDSSGEPVILDIKESALGGAGPHGMLIGATGSGKSELLRTLVLALAATHSSETLNFVLVDFKGGATFLGLDRLRHTSAVITNLADEAGLVSRMRDALQGELVRRQELLREAGGYSSVLDYERARAEGTPLAPLPTLFVIVDEFSELLAAHRDFIELFVMIGRLGRSLGVHLLLASQRVDDGRIGQLESHLSYRIGLRTFSAMESRSVIGVPDAYELPGSPGNGYLRTDISTLIRFKAAYVSGPHRRTRASRVRQEVIDRQVVEYGLAHVEAREPVVSTEVEPDAEEGRSASVLTVVVDQMAGRGPAAHQVWLPPLKSSPTLDALLPALEPDPERGLTATAWPGAGHLMVPVGYIDKPFEQLRDLLVVDLAGAGGHLGIAGGTRSGKSTLLRTLICSLALTHSPKEVQFYCLDFSGGALTSISGLPHVGGVAGRLEVDKVTRTIAEVNGLVTDRERRFGAEGIDSMATYRQMRADGRIQDDPYGDVFLVIDGWFTLRQDFEAAEGVIRQIAARGLNFGVHLLITAARWSEVHHTMRDLIGGKLELRLGDAVDSAIDLRMAATVPKLPGHGMTPDKLFFLAGMPRIDGVPDPATTMEGAKELSALVADFWPGAPAPAVRTLPSVLPADDLPAAVGDLRVALGLEEARMQPLWHDFSQLPHLSALGDVESGKTNLLRLIIRAIITRYSPAEARIMLVDQRRQLFDDVPAPYRLGYCVSVDSTREAAKDAIAGLRGRIPDDTVTPEQLRRRDWWSGPRLFVLVDDYDLLAGTDGPLISLLPYLANGADIGFHVVLVRGASNVMRMSMDPLLRRLQETNSPDLTLSCPPSEGPLLGGFRPKHLPAGRAMLLTRRGTRALQTGYVTTS